MSKPAHRQVDWTKACDTRSEVTKEIESFTSGLLPILESLMVKLRLFLAGKCLEFNERTGTPAQIILVPLEIKENFIKDITSDVGRKELSLSIENIHGHKYGPSYYIGNVATRRVLCVFTAGVKDFEVY